MAKVPFAQLNLPLDLPHPRTIPRCDWLVYVSEVMRRRRAESGDRAHSTAACALGLAHDIFGLDLTLHVAQYVAQRSWMKIPEPWTRYPPPVGPEDLDVTVKDLGF